MSNQAPDYHQEQLAKASGQARKSNRRTWLANASKLIFPVIAAGGYGRFESGWFDLSQTKIRIPNLPSNRTLRLIHLSDLHLSQAVSIDHIETGFAEGLQSNPHGCMITGDFITDRPDDDQLRALLQCLRKFAREIPTFACLGNHDGGIWAEQRGGFPNPEKIKALLKAANVRLLHNESANLYLNGIPLTITGLGDVWNKDCLPQKCMRRSNAKLGSSSRFNLLLSHNPDSKSIVRNFDWSLMLSGHTHGGQFRIPFSNFAPLAPISDLAFNEGLCDFEGRPVYVTRGVGSLYGIRINCRPEISLLELSRT